MNVFIFNIDICVTEHTNIMCFQIMLFKVDGKLNGCEVYIHNSHCVFQRIFDNFLITYSTFVDFKQNLFVVMKLA